MPIRLKIASVRGAIKDNEMDLGGDDAKSFELLIDVSEWFLNNEKSFNEIQISQAGLPVVGEYYAY